MTLLSIFVDAQLFLCTHCEARQWKVQALKMTNSIHLQWQIVSVSRTEQAFPASQEYVKDSSEMQETQIC